MKSEELFEFHKNTCEKLLNTMKKKNADYAGKGIDPFKNFNLVGHFGCVTPEQGFFTRMTDKFARISSFIESGKLEVMDETVEDTLDDLANYAILFKAYLNSKKTNPNFIDSKYSVPINFSNDCKHTLKFKDIKKFLTSYEFNEFMSMPISPTYKHKPLSHLGDLINYKDWKCSKIDIDFWYNIDDRWRNYCKENNL